MSVMIFLLFLITISTASALTVSVQNTVISGQPAVSKWSRSQADPEKYVVWIAPNDQNGPPLGLDFSNDVMLQVDSGGQLNWTTSLTLPSNLPAGLYKATVLSATSQMRSPPLAISNSFNVTNGIVSISSSPTISSPTTSTTPVTASSKAPSPPVPIIIGSILGGIVCLALLLFVLILRRKARQNREDKNIKPDPLPIYTPSAASSIRRSSKGRYLYSPTFSRTNSPISASVKRGMSPSPSPSPTPNQRNREAVAEVLPSFSPTLDDHDRGMQFQQAMDEILHLRAQLQTQNQTQQQNSQPEPPPY